MNERIRKLRKALDLTQQEFADRIGMKRNTIASYEINRNGPSNSVISLICKTYNVSETWLRTGEGEMFVQQNEADELAAMVERLITGESAEFKRRLVNALSTLKDEHWIFLEQKIQEIADMRDAAPAFAPAPVDRRTLAEKPAAEWTDAEINAEAEEYRRELLEEKRQAVSGSASAASGETKLA